MKWTSEQKQAIYAPMGEGNILVSAAAGSGKTAVLVERVLQKIISGSTSVDRLLVVTFTEAAAAEMREKIINRLIKEMENPSLNSADKKMLKAQVQLAEAADIMTIDAFCNRVVLNNFHILGISPDISIADEAMGKLLMSEAFENLFERLYKTDDADVRARFSRLTDAYSSNRNDSGLENTIRVIYKFISSFADPKKWLGSMADIYKLDLMDMPHMKYLLAVSKRAAENCISAVDQFNKINDNPELEEYADVLKGAAEAIYSGDWDDICKIYLSHFKSRKKVKSIIQSEPQTTNDNDIELKNLLTFIRNRFLHGLENGVVTDFRTIYDQYDQNLLLSEAEDIVWIVKEFINEFENVKDAHGVREFSDIEHLTYELFRDHEDIKNIYADKYDEILIDEYQDTNGLQDSVFTMISRSNIFMVGDLKQSIYRFRGGDPYIFKNKSEAYSAADSANIKITLSQNFRSRQEILKSVNDVFESIMSDEAGDVNYTDKELIVRHTENDYYPKATSDCHSELHYLMAGKDEDKEDEQIRFTVDKICDLLRSGVSVYDKDSGKMRPIRKKDIVILENSVKSNGEAIVKALSEQGIDAFTETESFFDRREISIMLSLISVINNAHQDIPLIAVLLSPIGGFSENELAKIRLSEPRCKDFIDALDSFVCSVPNAAENNGEAKDTELIKLAKRCNNFLQKLNKWRGYVRSKSVAQLIWTIYEETYFYDMMGAIEQGEEAQFNLRLLYDRACRYESAGFKGLFNFIRYIEQLESRDEDLSGAKLIGENHDVVRIMTIHKSKGLEFPYVFLIGMGKQFPPSRDTIPVKLHKDIGLGMPYIYYNEHYMKSNIICDLINDLNKRELASERMRLLYVALTRAREKLYVVVSRNVRDETADDLRKQLELKMTCKQMLPAEALSAKGFYDWICPAAIISTDSWKLVFHDKKQDKSLSDDTEQEENTYKDSSELKDAVYKILDYSYPYEESSLIPSRTSVTQLKELAIEQQNEEQAEISEPDSRRLSGADDIADLLFSPLHQKPAFMCEKGKKPANEIGTLYHLVMSEISLERLRRDGTECIDDELSRLVSENIISDEDMGYIDSKRIKAFYENDIGKRLLSSNEIHRESPFQINIPAAEYDPSLLSEYSDETVILQGIIDCFFKENGEYVLVDYKTDRIGAGGAEEIKKKYNKQLELYTQAIEQLTKQHVKESMLYLFDADITI